MLALLKPRIAPLNPKQAKGGWADARRGNRHAQGYGSKWDKVRAVVLERDRHMCQTCARGGMSADALRRRLPTLPKSCIPVTIVCGASGSGKSEYVRTHAGANHAVIDLDLIIRDMSGLPLHHGGKEWIASALDERNRQLAALATDQQHESAWFVIAAPNPIERAGWAAMLGAVVVVMPTDLAECIRRIEADPTRPNDARQQMIKNAAGWFAENEGSTTIGRLPIVKAANIVDHITPKFEGGTDDPSNLEAICKAHHDAKTRRESDRARGARG